MSDPMRMARPTARSIALALLASGLSLALAACYGDRLPPPAFRFQCDSNGDCKDGESCLDGLCQVPCTFATFEQDCPSGPGYVTCFNGACAHLCNPDEQRCPEPQACVAFDLSGFGDAGGGGGLGGLPSDQPFGVCGIACSDAADCPDGEVCIESACVSLGDPGDGMPTGGGTDSATGGTGSGSGTGNDTQGSATDTGASTGSTST